MLKLPLGANLKVLCPGGAYRCRILGLGHAGILVSAPLHDDHYVPLRPGEHVVGQCGDEEGLLTFHTTVLTRDAEAHTVLLAPAKAFRRSDRRSETRTEMFKGQTVAVGTARGEVVDTSLSGIRCLTKAPVTPGDRISLGLPQGLGDVSGYVLDSHPAYFDGAQGREVRIRLEDSVYGLGPRPLHLIR